MEVSRQGSRLSIQRRWFGLHLLFLLFFCIAWDGFLIFWYSIALTQENVPWIMVVFPVGHLAVGVGLTYYVVAGFMNRTEIACDGSTLSVRHFPLPWPGALTLRCADAEQFFTVEHIGSEGSRSYEVCAVLRDGRKVEVLGSLTNPGEALFLEQTLESYLGLENRAVAGEYRV